MAQIALPRQQVTQAPQSADIGSPLYQRRHASTAGPIELTPNPEFTFPMPCPDMASFEPESIPHARPLSLQAYPAARRGSASGLRQKSVSALPDFSFNPAGQSNTSTITTPPPSPLPTTMPTTPSRTIGGHRRRGSEFIGGDGRASGISLQSTSPTKGDNILPSPSASLRPGPPAGRRGHAHRRSGAISSHDLSSIMNPSAPTRTGSAPVTPLEGGDFVIGHAVNRSISQPSLRDAGFPPEDSDSPLKRPLSRARVGFSDKIEYIRPLSTISSETENSMSTIRGHSATNSLSSVISASTPSPQLLRTNRSSLSSTVESDGRPSTAGAILDQHKNIQFGNEMSTRKRPMSAISLTSSSAVISPVSPCLQSKRRSFFRLDMRRSESNTHSLPSSMSDPALSVSYDSPLPSPMVVDEEIVEECDQTKPAFRKASRRPRKVKSWANSIIPRKGKQGKNSKIRPTTSTKDSSPDLDDTDASEDLDFEANFDVDNTITIVSPTESSDSERKVATNIASWRPRQLKRVDSDTMSPVIDLDAALGPFNTPDGSSPHGQQRGFGAHRRAMHSAGGLIPNHRRTESAPALVPFELRASTAATTTAMADVFEEEEPEEDISAPTSTTSENAERDCEELDEPRIQLVDSDGIYDGSTINWNFGQGLRIERSSRMRASESSDCVSPLADPQSAPSGSDAKQLLDVSAVQVVEDDEEPHTSSLTHSSDSTVTPQILASDTKDTPALHLSLPLPQQSLMTPDTFTSSFPSPGLRSSQASFDTPRLGTAASSMTDYRAMPSPQFGEPGPELRISVDDVPSLTSSRSTMASAMQNAFPLIGFRGTGDRSASLCSDPSVMDQRRRKRSSIASLSRLINGSSLSEKSKLSIEQRPQSEHREPTKETKKKQHKRLSKLMQFWKSKASSQA